ncbi:MAG: hypothetical protein PHW74_12555, partial [Desulfobacca sp.]|nr:hypothetical protein [Desulfobacca sp.]
EKAHRKMPEDCTIAEHLGDAYVKKQLYRKALQIYKRALQLECDNKPELEKKIQRVKDLIKEMAL